MRLMSDLDAVHRELCELRMRTFAAPTLRDAVSRPAPVAPRPALVPAAAAEPAEAPTTPMFTPALSMAG
jgi:hypothetical protein